MSEETSDSGFEPDEPEWCLIHGYDHMRKRSIFDKIAYCTECEREREEAARP